MIKNNLYFFVKFYSRLNNISSKKCITPVVATALLVVVAVVAVVGFQTFFNTYSSGMFSKVETQSNEGGVDGKLSIETLIGTTLYIKNNVIEDLSYSSLKIGGIDCNLSGNLTFGINEINVNDCISNLTTETPNIVLITQTKILDKKIYYPERLEACNLDSLRINSGNSAVFYNSSSGFSTCYSQIRECTDGNLNGTSTYNQSTCISYYDLSCNTDFDSDDFIDSTCAVYPMTNTTFAGNLDTNDINSTIYPDMNCIFDGDKNATSCINNFVVDGCGSGTVQDISTNLCWQRNMNQNGTKNWANAITYCSTTLDGLGGHTDWRLPTHQELKTIVDLSRSSPSIIGGNGNKFQNVITNDYWTYSTSNVGSMARVINFNPGYSSTGLKTASAYVVCVR